MLASAVCQSSIRTSSGTTGLESGNGLMAVVPLYCFPCPVSNLTRRNLYLFPYHDATWIYRPQGVYAVEWMAYVMKYSEGTLHAWTQVGGLEMECVCGVLEVLDDSVGRPSGNAAAK